MDGSGYYGHRVRVRLRFTGLGARAWPKWEGRSPKRRTKCLTLTERRLSFTFGEGTPRPEGQAFRAAVRWAIHFGLILWCFLIKKKARIRQKDGNTMPAAAPARGGMTWLLLRPEPTRAAAIRLILLAEILAEALLLAAHLEEHNDNECDEH